MAASFFALLLVCLSLAFATASLAAKTARRPSRVLLPLRTPRRGTPGKTRVHASPRGGDSSTAPHTRSTTGQREATPCVLRRSSARLCALERPRPPPLPHTFERVGDARGARAQRRRRRAEPRLPRSPDPGEAPPAWRCSPAARCRTLALRGGGERVAGATGRRLSCATRREKERLVLLGFISARRLQLFGAKKTAAATETIQLATSGKRRPTSMLALCEADLKPDVAELGLRGDRKSEGRTRGFRIEGRFDGRVSLLTKRFAKV
ncbi:hypothetical protein MTO96_005813 [Rhipicephalus appendiculatus]